MSDIKIIPYTVNDILSDDNGNINLFIYNPLSMEIGDVNDNGFTYISNNIHFNGSSIKYEAENDDIDSLFTYSDSIRTNSMNYTKHFSNDVSKGYLKEVVNISSPIGQSSKSVTINPSDINISNKISNGVYDLEIQDKISSLNFNRNISKTKETILKYKYIDTLEDFKTESFIFYKDDGSKESEIISLKDNINGISIKSTLGVYIDNNSAEVSFNKDNGIVTKHTLLKHLDTSSYLNKTDGKTISINNEDELSLGYEKEGKYNITNFINSKSLGIYDKFQIIPSNVEEDLEGYNTSMEYDRIELKKDDNYLRIGYSSLSMYNENGKSSHLSFNSLDISDVYSEDKASFNLNGLSFNRLVIDAPKTVIGMYTMPLSVNGIKSNEGGDITLPINPNYFSYNSTGALNLGSHTKVDNITKSIINLSPKQNGVYVSIDSNDNLDIISYKNVINGNGFVVNENIDSVGYYNTIEILENELNISFSDNTYSISNSDKVIIKSNEEVDIISNKILLNGQIPVTSINDNIINEFGETLEIRNLLPSVENKPSLNIPKGSLSSMSNDGDLERDREGKLYFTKDFTRDEVVFSNDIPLKLVYSENLQCMLHSKGSFSNYIEKNGNYRDNLDNGIGLFSKASKRYVIKGIVDFENQYELEGNYDKCDITYNIYLTLPSNSNYLFVYANSNTTLDNNEVLLYEKTISKNDFNSFYGEVKKFERNAFWFESTINVTKMGNSSELDIFRKEELFGDYSLGKILRRICIMTKEGDENGNQVLVDVEKEEIDFEINIEMVVNYNDSNNANRRNISFIERLNAYLDIWRY